MQGDGHRWTLINFGCVLMLSVGTKIYIVVSSPANRLGYYTSLLGIEHWFFPLPLRVLFLEAEKAGVYASRSWGTHRPLVGIGGSRFPLGLGEEPPA